MQLPGGPPPPHGPGRHAKRKSRRAAEQDRPEPRAERGAWREEFLAVHASRLVFLDESGASTAMGRTHGRAASGRRVDGPVPHGHWGMTMLTAAVRLDGLIQSACQASNRPTDAAWFVHYVATCMAPSLKAGDVVVMDNLSSHESAEVTRLIEAAGANVHFLPPDGPDLNPIEARFSKYCAWRRRGHSRH